MIDSAGQVAVMTARGGQGRLLCPRPRAAGSLGDRHTAGGLAVASYDSVDGPEGGQAIVDSAIEHYGRLDAVVSNAESSTAFPSNSCRPDDWRHILRVHLDGRLHLSQPAFTVMMEQK